jgi:hypothetical protein
VLALGILLYEMASLSPSLSLLYRAKIKKFDEFPKWPKGKYSDGFKKIMLFVCQ